MSKSSEMYPYESKEKSLDTENLLATEIFKK